MWKKSPLRTGDSNAKRKGMTSKDLPLLFVGIGVVTYVLVDVQIYLDNIFMDTKSLFLRCFAEEVDGQWMAYCLDLSLAAQADTFTDVKEKLESMIHSYVIDALDGEDKAFADQLLNRPAPLRIWLRYWGHRVMSTLAPLQALTL